MGFYEDDRIRNKNKVDKDPDELVHTFNLVISESCSLAQLLKVLNDNNIEVSLRGTNTIVIE